METYAALGNNDPNMLDRLYAYLCAQFGPTYGFWAFLSERYVGGKPNKQQCNDKAIMEKFIDGVSIIKYWA